MRARAVWLAREDEPRTPLGWLAQDLGAPLRIVGQDLAWGVRVLAAITTIRDGVVGGALVFLLSFPIEMAFESLSCLRLALWNRRTRRFERSSLPVGELLTLPPPTTLYPCAVEVRKAGTLLGRDVGIVTFLDGWLHFEGRRTSFTLRRSDVYRRQDEQIVLGEGGEVAFRPQDWLFADDLAERGLATRFCANLKSWMRSDAPCGDSILPPATAHPSGRARAWTSLIATLASGTLLATALAPDVPSLGLAALIAPLAGSSLLAARSLFRLRRAAPPSWTRSVHSRSPRRLAR